MFLKIILLLFSYNCLGQIFESYLTARQAGLQFSRQLGYEEWNQICMFKDYPDTLECYIIGIKDSSQSVY